MRWPKKLWMGVHNWLPTALFAVLIGISALLALAQPTTISMVSGSVPVTVVGRAVLGYSAASVGKQQALVITPNPVWFNLQGSAWIGIASGYANSPVGGYAFTTSFELPEQFSDPTLSIVFASDDQSAVFLNGYNIGSTGSTHSYTSLSSGGTNQAERFRKGTNVLEFDVVNAPPTGYLNPAGLTFAATITFDSPTITVTQSVHGPFLHGIPFLNTFTVICSDPSKLASVRFTLNGTTRTVAAGLGGASTTYDMGSDLRSGPCLTDNILQVVGYDSRGKSIGNATLDLQCQDSAPWMLGLQASSVDPLTKQVVYSVEYCYPDADIDATASVPSWVPLIGGKTGAELKKDNTCLGIKVKGGQVTASVKGSASIKLANHEESLDVMGSATFCTCPISLQGSSIGLNLSTKFPASFDWPIPGLTKAEVAFKPKLSASLVWQEGDRSCQSGSMHFKQGYGTFTPTLEGSLKVGMNWWASTQGTVGITANGWSLTIPGNPWLTNGGGNLYASLKTCLLGLCQKREWNWDIGDRTLESSGSALVTAASSRGPDTSRSSWSRDCRDYLRLPDTYMKMAPSIAKAASVDQTQDSSIGTEQMLIQNTYPHAFPRLATNGDQAALFYCYDANTMGAATSLQIGAMQYNGSAWTTMPNVTDSAYTNIEPWVTYDSTGKLVCVWVGCPTATGQETDPTQMFPKMEIFASSYDGSAWSTPQQLTNNGYVDALPKVIRGADGVITALWISQASNQFPIWPDDLVSLSCTLWAADWNGSYFGTPYSLSTGLAVTYTPDAVRLADGRILTLVSQSTNGMSNAYADRQIFLLNWKAGTGTIKQLTSDSFRDDYPLLTALADGSVVAVWAKMDMPSSDGQTGETTDQLWYENVWPSQGTAAKVCDTPSITDLQANVDGGGDVISFWTCGSPQGSDIYYAAYQTSTDTWSEPQQLTQDLAPEKMLTAGLVNGSVLCAYLKTQASVQDQPETMPDGSIKIVHEVVLGDSDLYALTHAPFTDIALSDSDLSTSPAPSPGESVTISATPHCWGDTEQTTTVTFYDGDPANGGAEIGSDTQAIPAGGKATFDVAWTVPSTNTSVSIYAVVDPNDTVAEDNEDNNTGHICLFAPDLFVSSPQLVSTVGTQVVVQSLISNKSQSPSANVPWEMRLDGPMGILLASGTTDPIDASEDTVVSAAFDTASLSANSATIYVVADPQQEIADSDRSNNAATGVIDFLPDIAVNQGSAAVSGNNATLTVTNEGVRETGSFIVQATDSTGVVLGLATVDSIQPGSSADVTVSITAGQAYTSIYLTANPDRTVDESRTDNNSTFVAASNYSTVAKARTLTDGTEVSLTDKVITASFGDSFYIEEPDRSAGIKVVWATPPTAGTTAAVSGQIATQGTELVIFADSVTPGSSAEVRPIGVTNRNVGGHIGTFGFTDPEGLGSLYNMGLLIRTTGTVTYADTNNKFTYIDDGSSLSDENTLGTEGVPVTCLRVILPAGVSTPPVGSYVIVTGISSSDTVNGNPARAIKTRSQDDIILATGSAVSGKVTQGGNQTISQVVESPHNYPDDYNSTWTITGPTGTAQIRVHFTQIETESGYDHLYVNDGSGTINQTYDGTYNDLWSEWVVGDTVALNLTSDGSVTYYGFQVDQYEVQIANVPVPGVTLMLSPGSLTAQSLADGSYSFKGLSAGTYTITPSLEGITFAPQSREVTVSNGQYVPGVDFVRQ